MVDVRALDTWTLEAQWNSSSAEETHEVQVMLTSRSQLLFQSNITGGPFFSWIWTSSFPLQCADHSVRVRRIFNQTVVSSWSQWTTSYGLQSISSTEIRLFPKEKVLKEGSSAHFCCIPPDSAQVTEILFRNRAYELIRIDPQVRAIEVHSLNATYFGVNLICRVSTGSERFTLNYVTFPPEKPQNIYCWTKDLRKIICSWSASQRPDLSDLRYCRRYSLHIQDAQTEVKCDGKTPSCDFAALSNHDFYNISIRVNNSLGEQSQTYTFNITQRVFPDIHYLSVLPGVTDVTVSWVLSGHFTGLCFSCEITLEPTAKTSEQQFIISDPEQRLSTSLQELKPSSYYSTRVRCALQGNSWGPWSSTLNFTTEPLVTVDIWTKIRHHFHNRTVTLLWKSFNSGTDSNVEAYEVCLCVEPNGTQSKKCVNVTELMLEFSLGQGVCSVSVRALTLRGSSITSYFTIPALGSVFLLKEKRIVGNLEGFLLSWTPLSSATCGYAVEWNTMWRKVSANQTSLLLSTEMFRKGVRYTFLIYSCVWEEYRVHEKHTGYLQEQKPDKVPDLILPLSLSWSSVELKWKFNEYNASHPGFITGYKLTIHYWRHSHSFLNISVEDPHSKSLPVIGLNEGQKYTLRLSACTQVGCGPEFVYTFTTPSNNYLLIVKIVTPLFVLTGCCICLWLCKETLRGVVEDVSSFPSERCLKILELDASLYEVSEKLRILQVEDCRCCDLDFEENSALIFTKSYAKCSHPVRDKEEFAKCPEPVRHDNDSGVWGGSGMSAINLTYMSSPVHPSPFLVSPSPVSPSNSPVSPSHSPANTSDYVTSIPTVTM
ncbi:leukemia inhibitory factor receptor-like [Hoplias malabaricus]|uniref:leukemia inhibitory factor receptor-like n=1 Tax=Hoplias malabaricus TaxID=27720 RepID=UPI003461BE2D